MYLREQDRWNQWALFFFGAITSIFVIIGGLYKVGVETHPRYVIVALGLGLVFAILVSLLWVGAGIGLSRSSKAWRMTLIQIEAEGKYRANVFEIYERINDRSRRGLSASLSIFKL